MWCSAGSVGMYYLGAGTGDACLDLLLGSRSEFKSILMFKFMRQSNGMIWLLLLRIAGGDCNSKL
jgi:hypothetical protein